MQLANENARPADAEDVIYDDVFDTPFGYLTSSQQDVYDVLSEVGTYTALEDVANPFADPDTDEEPTCRLPGGMATTSICRLGITGRSSTKVYTSARKPATTYCRV